MDFTTINTTISTALAADRRCGLCAGEIGYWAAFLGGPRAAELMQYTDPPGCVVGLTEDVGRTSVLVGDLSVGQIRVGRRSTPTAKSQVIDRANSCQP